MKKPSEYTKIERETIVGSIIFLLLAIIVTIVIETINRVTSDNSILDVFTTLWSLSPSPLGTLIALVILVVLILGFTAIPFAIVHLVLKEKGMLPKIEGHIKIWNPFNKTRFIMNPNTERPDIIYILRRPDLLLRWKTIPNWIRRRFEQIALPTLLIGLIFVLGLNAYGKENQWVQTWIAIPFTWFFFLVTALLIFYIITFSFWIGRKAVLTEEEYKTMIPHLEKADKLIFGFGGECFYKAHFWIVSKEDYDQLMHYLVNESLNFGGLENDKLSTKEKA